MCLRPRLTSGTPCSLPTRSVGVRRRRKTVVAHGAPHRQALPPCRRSVHGAPRPPRGRRQVVQDGDSCSELSTFLSVPLPLPRLGALPAQAGSPSHALSPGRFRARRSFQPARVRGACRRGSTIPVQAASGGKGPPSTVWQCRRGRWGPRRLPRLRTSSERSSMPRVGPSRRQAG